MDALSYRYSKLNADTGIMYAKQADAIADKIGNKNLKARVYADLAMNFDFKCDYKASVSFNKRALELFKGTGNFIGQGGVLGNMCLSSLNQGHYAEGLNYGFRALKILETVHDDYTATKVYENIGCIYLEQNKLEKAFYYYSLAFEFYKSRHDTAGIARTLGNEGIILNLQKQFSKALDYHLRALDNNTRLHDKRAMQINMANVGISYSNQGQYDKAIKYHRMALAVSEALDDKRSQAINRGNIGETYLLASNTEIPRNMKQKYLLEAQVELSTALNICHQIHFPGPEMEFSLFLSQAYKQGGQYKKALDKYEYYMALKDSDYVNETALKIASLEEGYELDLKNRALQLESKNLQLLKLEIINRQNERVILFVGIAFLVSVILGMILLFRFRIKGHKKILSDISFSQSHEVRAPLARILGLIDLFDRADLSNKTNLKILDHIRSSAVELDGIVHKVVYMSQEKKAVTSKRFYNKLINTLRRLR